MKKAMLCVVLMAVLVGLMGCTNIPTGVKSALYTAEITLTETVKDAEAGTREPWVIPPNSTVEEISGSRLEQVELLLRTMEQVTKNLQAVVEYFRTGKEITSE